MRGLPVYVVGVAFFGGVIGLLTGLSETSAVTTVLGSVFALLGAAGAFYLPWSQSIALPATSRQSVADAAVAEARAAVDDATKALGALSANETTASATLASAQEAEVAARVALTNLPEGTSEDKMTAAQSAVVTAEAEVATAVSAWDAAKKARQTGLFSIDEARARLEGKLSVAELAAQDGQRLAEQNYAKTYVAAGLSLTAFGIGFILAMLYGALLRGGGSWEDLIPISRRMEVAANTDTRTIVSTILLDRLLVAMRIDPEVRRQVIAKAGAACDERIPLLRAATEDVLTKTLSAKVRPLAIENPDGLEALRRLLNEGTSAGAATQAAIAKAVLDATRFLRDPRLAGAAPEAVEALVTFQAIAVGYLGCMDANGMLEDLIADLKQLKDTSVGEVLAPSTSVESR